MAAQIDRPTGRFRVIFEKRRPDAPIEKAHDDLAPQTSPLEKADSNLRIEADNCVQARRYAAVRE
jgi:hypothetical protein